MSEVEVTTDQSQSQTLLSSNLTVLVKYMRFLGLLQMIGGVLYCITIIGAIIGIPVFIMGKRLREAADSFLNYNTSGSSKDLELAIEKQTKSFFIQYVLAIISLVLFVIYIIVLIGILIAGGF